MELRDVVIARSNTRTSSGRIFPVEVLNDALEDLGTARLYGPRYGTVGTDLSDMGYVADNIRMIAGNMVADITVLTTLFGAMIQHCITDNVPVFFHIDAIVHHHDCIYVDDGGIIVTKLKIMAIHANPVNLYDN